MKFKFPKWHPLPIYSKSKSETLTSETWLQEIYKRVTFQRKLREKEYTVAEKEALFYAIIINYEIDDVLKEVKPILPQPFKPISMTELLIMAFQLVNSPRYQTFSQRSEIEDAILTFLTRGIESMTLPQKNILYVGKDIPWYAFIDEKPAIKWLPEIHPFINGIPMTFEPGFYREDSIDELRKLITEWQKPKKNLKPLTKEILKKWQDQKILEYFDFSEWFMLQNNPLDNTEFSKILWPTSIPSKRIVDSTERRLDTFIASKKAAKKYISGGTLQTLFRACESRAAQRAAIKPLGEKNPKESSH